MTTKSYTAADLPDLIEKINKNTIGVEQYFTKIFQLHETSSNYPPYNHIEINSTEQKIELALAGFKRKQVVVYTQDGKLFVEGQKEDKETGNKYIHKGLALRSFTRAWTLSDETEVRSVEFEDGLLTIILGKVVPEHHSRKNYL